MSGGYGPREEISAGATWIGTPEHGRCWAYGARPAGDGPHPGLVVLHHNAGVDAGTREIVRRFAAEGYSVLAPDLHYRDAPGATSPEAAKLAREAEGPPDGRVAADVDDALFALSLQPGWNGRSGVVGFCSGGRQAFLVAAQCEPDAAVVLYGGRIVTRKAVISGIRPVAPIELASKITCPMLCLSGAEDSNPSPADAAEIDAALTRAGVEHSTEIVEGAGHAFFDAYRDTYRPNAVLEVWPRIIQFLDSRLR